VLALTQRGLSLAPKPVLAPANTLLTLPTLRSNALLALAQPPSAEQASRLLTAHSGLRLEAWLASCTGREHARMGQVRGPWARSKCCLGASLVFWRRYDWSTSSLTQGATSWIDPHGHILAFNELGSIISRAVIRRILT